MTVSEYIRHLSKMPQDAKVIATNDVMGFHFEANKPSLVDDPTSKVSGRKGPSKAVLVGL